MKSSWMGIGFSHHRVPSLSNVAMRSDGGTKCGPSSVTERTKSRIASLLVPFLQLPSTSSFTTARGHLSVRDADVLPPSSGFRRMLVCIGDSPNPRLPHRGPKPGSTRPMSDRRTRSCWLPSGV